eukprot:Selendium_serpulae@DN4244_c0_g1_i1.p1
MKDANEYKIMNNDDPHNHNRAPDYEWTKKYKTLELVGVGNYGRATLVEAQASGKRFIMKTIDLSLLSTKARRAAFREARLLAACRHPYIISFRDSFVDTNHLDIVMDYAQGGDLGAKLKTHKDNGVPISESQLLLWLTQTVIGVRYLHQRRIFHRDLKPTNMFLSETGRIKIGDFGLSRLLETNDVWATTVAGTPNYMSPEILSGETYGFPSDIWALGCVLYQLLNLKSPFEAKDLKQLIQKIRFEELGTMTNSPHSEVLKTLCRRMLEKDPLKRPTVDEVNEHYLIQNTILQMLTEERDKISNGDKISNKDKISNGSHSRKCGERGSRPKTVTGKRDEVERSKR